ncbi:MAG: TetR family transcriptional regulator C-terminal domain-containing protein [Flavobacteriales bacterium]|jgi:hypothetical protein|nr:TetR family transcriptional regulator C-terminal domain-containing protein [Flavobacteriales bacterium]
MNEEIENIDLKALLQNEYILYLLRNGKPPVTVFAFCEQLEISETDFYAVFNSFKVLESSIWEHFFNETLHALNQDAEFPSYSSHEKVLSFLYTIIEVFKQNRSFIVLKVGELSRKEFRPKSLTTFRTLYNNWTKEIVSKGLETEEIATRPIITEKYDEVFWGQFLYILRVWINDESNDFQTTDAAIEKTSALIFELLKKGPIDLLIDFLKFAYQNKAY